MAYSTGSSWFRGIKGKLLFAAVLPVIGFGILFSTSFSGLNKFASIISTAHESLVPNLDAMGALRTARNRFGYNAYAVISEFENPQAKTPRLEEMKQAQENFKTNLDAYEKAPFLPGEEEAYNKVKNSYLDIQVVMKDIYELLDSNDPGKAKQAKALLEGKYLEIGAPISKFNSSTIKMYRDTAKAQATDAASTKTQTTNLVVLVSLCASLLTFGILLWLAQKVSSTVGSIAEKLSGSASQVATSVEQLNEAGNTLSSSSTEAAASLEETVASLEEMTSMVKMGSDNARQAASLATASCESAETGAREIQNLIKSMNQISASSKKIEEIISVIDDIAFQTNLLALNAAVEAARAGEQGKGFAVVAEAVRALAQRSASSAKDISGLIKDSVAQIETGSAIADKSGTILSNIVGSIKKVSDLNGEIASASQEQATGIEQINKAMSQLDQAGQSNAASAEEISATSGEISHLATTTQDLTVELNVIILGGTTEVVSSPKLDALKYKPSNVTRLPQKAANKTRQTAAAKIPFDDDSRGSVGDASGF